jgi:hypothetical protein
MWPRACGGSLGSASPRGGLPCYHIHWLGPHPWRFPWLRLPEIWAPVWPCGPMPMAAPLAPPALQARSHAATWSCTHSRSLGLTSPIGGPSCSYVVPRPWWHPGSAAPGGVLPHYHVAPVPPTRYPFSRRIGGEFPYYDILKEKISTKGYISSILIFVWPTKGIFLDMQLCHIINQSTHVTSASF